jgi:acrylyl-CoA reductase (NADPH)
MNSFRAFLITRDEATNHQRAGFATLTPADLMPGDLDIRVEHSAVNYKDGLAITGKLPVVRRFPMIPGAELAGTVTASTHAGFRPGDKVVVNGWGLGELHLGGYSQMARINGDWAIPLPAGFTTAEAMAVGIAGFTAMLSIMALEAHGLTPQRGPVVVTGAAGGVGSMATALLSGLGYAVHAVTGRAHEHNYLRGLGASAIIDRAELAGAPKTLAKERWAGGIDSVGGAMLANVISMTQERGAVASVGNASGWDLPTTTAPFILRGVSLLGIESVRSPKPERLQAWKRLASDLDRGKLAAMTTAMDFHAVENAAHDIVAGKVRGRLVVTIG